MATLDGWWPPQQPMPPRPWKREHVEALRAVVRYLAGVHPVSKIATSAGLSDRKPVERFIKRETSFDFRNYENRPAIQRVPNLDNLWKYALEQITAEQKAQLAVEGVRDIHDAIEPQLAILFYRSSIEADNRRRQASAAIQSAYEFLGKDQKALTDAAKIICGVYRIYRLGDLEHRPRRIVKNAMSIWALGEARELRCEVAYRPVHGVAPFATIEGAFIPCHAGFAMLGVDNGYYANPCLYIVRQQSMAREAAFKGIMLRVNSRSELMAARFVMHRVERPDAAPLSQRSIYDDEKVDLGPMEEAEKLAALRRELPEIDKWLDNGVDNEIRHVLLGLDRGSEPPSKTEERRLNALRDQGRRERPRRPSRPTTED